MGFLDLLVTGLTAYETVSNIVSGDSKYYKVKCRNVEVFELREVWRGTAKVYEAGEHISSDSTCYNDKIAYPNKDDNSRYTRRGVLRKNLRESLANYYSLGQAIDKESIILNPSEDCLSLEGFAKKVNGKWMLTKNASNATNYVSYKLFFAEESTNKPVRNEELRYLFIEETLGRITRVDVK